MGTPTTTQQGTLQPSISPKPPACTTEEDDVAGMKDNTRGRESKSCESKDTSNWVSRILRNIPESHTRQDVIDLLISKGLQFEFIYLPVDWGTRFNLGYAFVTLVSHEEAKRLEIFLDGFSDWKTPCKKVCEVVWGKEEQQSLTKNIERFRNSPVMHPDVPDDFKPLLFTTGQRSTLPGPTKRIWTPRGLKDKIGCPTRPIILHSIPCSRDACV